MNESMMMVLYLIVFLAAMVLGLKMDKKLRITNPQAHPYAFGYFMGFLGILILPAVLIQHFYLPGAKMVEINLPMDIACALISVGILYRRSLAWMVMLLGSFCYIIAPFITPMAKKPFASLDNVLSPYVTFDEAYEMVISLVILLVITLYFMKRRHEMPLI